MALAGEVFDAPSALTLGLVDKVVPKGGSLEAAKAVAAQITARSPSATRLTKLLINAAEGEEKEAALETMGGFIAADSADLAKGLEAFRNRRKAEF